MTAHPFPHTYTISAKSSPADDVTLENSDLPTLRSAPPAQFGGPGNKWSPEDLLVAAIADCFVLTFHAIAQASRFTWIDIECIAEGKLDKVERQASFTSINLVAKLTVEEGIDLDKAKSLLEKAEENCMITNSLRSTCTLVSSVVTLK